jgi:hypothetical protein
LNEFRNGVEYHIRANLSIANRWKITSVLGFVFLADPRAVMARPLRIEYPGAHYHVVNRENNQEKIF